MKPHKLPITADHRDNSERQVLEAFDKGKALAVKSDPQSGAPIITAAPGDTIRVSGNFERAKLRDPKKKREMITQHVLDEGHNPGEMLEEIEKAVKVTGLDNLGAQEMQAIHALQILQHDAGANKREGEFKIWVPITHYLTAYGLDRDGGKGRQEAIDVLSKLREERVVYMSNGKNKKVIKIQGGIAAVSVITELERVPKEHREQHPLARTWLCALLEPIFTHGINRFHIHKPRDYYPEIKRVNGGQVSEELDALLTWFLITSEYSGGLTTEQQRLIELLGLGKYWNENRKKLVREKIDKAIRQAVELGYLLSWSRDDSKLDPKYTFHRNPERCRMMKHSPSQKALETPRRRRRFYKKK